MIREDASTPAHTPDTSTGTHHDAGWHHRQLQTMARRHIGQPALFIAVLALGLLLAFAASCWAATIGAIPLWLATPINAVVLYFLFTPIHEAIHGTIRGRDRSLSWLNDTVGWICGVVAIVPFRGEGRLHFLHHRYTNDPERDPDYSIAGTGALDILLRCLFQIPAYVHHFSHGDWSSTPQRRRERLIGVLHLVGAVASLAVATILGFGTEVLLLWLLPACLGVALVAYVFDWMVHHPYSDTDRIRASTIILAPTPFQPLLNALCLWQNHHLVHHLFPGIPCHRLGRAFDEMRPHLEALGARIEVIGGHHTSGGPVGHQPRSWAI